MGAVTRKRAADPEAQHICTSKRIRGDRGSKGCPSPCGSPPLKAAPIGSPAAKLATQGTPTSKKGSRGAAFLAAAGIVLPLPASAPKLSTKKDSAIKAARRAANEQAAEAAAAAALLSAAKQRNPLLEQALPKKLTTLLDMFGGLQTVYEMMRKRGQRTTYQNMRQTVEEASGRRFLLCHVAQLKHLLPEALELEWVRLPVAAHSSRTEPHLLITLSMAAGAAGSGTGTPASSAGAGELQATRRLLHCRLAAHLLDSYRALLGGMAAEARRVGDQQAAEQLEAAAQAAAEPPVTRFVPPYPEGVAEVPEQQLPQRPEAPTPASRALSPAVPPGSRPPQTPPTTRQKPPPSTPGRQGRPPVHPNTVGRMQRYLSFGADGAGGGEAAAASAGGAMPSHAALAAAAGARLGVVRSSRSCSPLDKLTAELGRQQEQQQQQQQDVGGGKSAAAAGGEQASSGAAAAAALPLQLHPRQAELADCTASLDFAPAAAVLGREGSQPSDQDAALLASMPEELRRRSTDGIISLETLRMLEAADQQHRRLSSKEAVQAREASAALGQLPRTFSRLQRIFGMQGPNALKLRDVVVRIKRGGAETSSEAQIEAQLRALADHAPEYLSLKPYGSCGTAALWVNRGANANAVMQRLLQVAEGRLQQRAAPGAPEPTAGA